ncbi:hypothetical protein RF11_05097 [Thelohanellus kitauei]|uniref:Uncharacterized protein n=1 Tax=Thelohanellus kitauei TaxID=669202 RepID=A0A0C2MA50_THEKT|nr:hypothetical protein RF11_05097 [Thelohanellus kitauei]
MALIDDSILNVFGCEYENPFLSNTLERFAVQPSSLNRLCLESIMGLPDMRTIIESLPASIVDELRVVLQIMALIDDSILYVYGGDCNVLNRYNKLERFALQPPSLDRLCLEYIITSQDVRTITGSLPVSKADELNINTTV